MSSSADDEDHECAYLANPVHSATHIWSTSASFSIHQCQKYLNAYFLCEFFTSHYISSRWRCAHKSALESCLFFWPEIGQFAREEGIGLDQKA